MTADAPEGLLAGQRPPWPRPLLGRIRRLGRGRLVAVLDDDPTGTQTVRDVPVVARLDRATVGHAAGGRPRTVFVSTNSRALGEAPAVELAEVLGRWIAAAAERHARAVTAVSRSDSTLRGHFPAEVDALARGLGRPDARILLMPFFGPGGRLTLGGRHHLVRDGRVVPVAETEFARDPRFGYATSDLVAWARARLGDPARSVELVGLAELRSGGPERIAGRLDALSPRGVLVIDAVDERDADVAAAGSLAAELAGVPLVARTAASFVRAVAGQPEQPLLPPADVPRGDGPGLVAVGSFVSATTRQLERILADPPCPLELVELPATETAAGSTRSIGAAAARARWLLARGTIPVLATSRERLDLDALAAARVSRALASVVAGLGRRPAWVVAKGGITSSDVATHGLGIGTARVLGQLRPGIPVWRAGRDARWPGVALVVFPGNVGDDTELRRVVALLAD